MATAKKIVTKKTTKRVVKPTKKVQVSGPKFKIGSEVFFIDVRTGTVVRGKVEMQHTLTVPVRDLVNKKIVDQETFYNYSVETNLGVIEKSEIELFSTFSSVALKFTSLYLR